MSWLDRLRGKAPEAAFWEWFAANSVRLAALCRSDGPRAVDEIGKRLHRAHPGLAPELGIEPEGGACELIIGADGIRDHFPTVEQLAAAAPPLDGWRVIAFRQRKSPDFSIRMHGRELDMDDLWFSATPDGERLDVVLYVRGLTEKNFNEVAGAAFVFLDSVLGEYDVATRLGEIDWRPLELDVAGVGRLPLRKLPEMVDALKARA